MFIRHHLHHIFDIISRKVDIDRKHDWGPLLIVAIIVLLTGFLLPLAWWIRYRCAASVWDHEDRWRGTKQFALTLLFVIYVPLFLNLLFFHIPIVHWVYFTSTSTWSNLLVFCLNVGIWWIMLLPLAPTLALLIEWIHPKTRDPKRILLPWELPRSPHPHRQAKRRPSRMKRAVTYRSMVRQKKRKNGRVQTAGELILEEQAKREIHTSEDRQQLLLPSPQAITLLPEKRGTTSLPSTGSAVSKTDKGKGESLKELF